jgi:hypothetical protein
MSVPSIGLYRNFKHEYYWEGNGPLAGVTSVVGVLDKSGALVGWAKRETAECAVRNLPMLTQMVASGGPLKAVEWLKGIPDYQKDTAADLGSAVHSFAEQIARGEEPDVQVESLPFITAYRRFLAEYQPRYLAVEEMVANLTHGYGGTLDAIAEINGEVWLLDTKTSRGAYVETALQLAAYGMAEFIGRTNDPTRYALPAIERYGVLHLNPYSPDRPKGYPEGYRLIPYTVGDDEREAFLSALLLLRWRRGAQMEQALPVMEEAA